MIPVVLIVFGLLARKRFLFRFDHWGPGLWCIPLGGLLTEAAIPLPRLRFGRSQPVVGPPGPPMAPGYGTPPLPPRR